MEQSSENPIRAKLERQHEITRQIEELEENRVALKRDLDAHKIPEIAQEIDRIDNQLMQLRIEDEFLKGETE